MKIERSGFGDHWAIGYRKYRSLYDISTSVIDDGNCNLTIKIGNENDTFMIYKDKAVQMNKYFAIFQHGDHGSLLQLSLLKDLDESFDNFSIYLNCRKEKCQVENIRVKSN